MFSIVLHLINYIITAPNTKSETFNLIGFVLKYYSLDDRLNHALLTSLKNKSINSRTIDMIFES